MRSERWKKPVPKEVNPEPLLVGIFPYEKDWETEFPISAEELWTAVRSKKENTDAH